MEILMDFNKPSISKKIEKFLLDNLKTEKEKESLINVTTGKSVLKCDAIALLISLIQAMTIVDEKDGEEFEPVISIEDDSADPRQGTSKQADVIVSVPIGQPKIVPNLGPDPKEFDPKKTLCKFYANGACKFKHECKLMRIELSNR